VLQSALIAGTVMLVGTITGLVLNGFSSEARDSRSEEMRRLDAQLHG
jgi:hypothetical protein